MNKVFNNILIPADLSINTEIAVKKALELSENGTVIHLLHIQRILIPGFSKITRESLFTENNPPRSEINKHRLAQWKESIEDYSKNIKVHTYILSKDSIQGGIEEKASQLAADLIIIGKNSSHSWLPFMNTVIPSKIVRNTGIPVLTVKPGSFYNKTKTIVLPVSTETAREKMEIISGICKKFKIRIYLVTFLDDDINNPGANVSTLLQAYKLIKNTINCPVDYAVLRGRNKAKSILKYAEKINADFLLLYPETETSIGWMNGHISDILPPSTKVEIFAVRQFTSLV